MIVLELLITIVGVTALILVLAGVLLRPWWAGVLRRCRAEAEVERRMDELARATEAARAEAEAEVAGWVEEPAFNLEAWGFIVEDVLIREIHPQKEITEKIKEQQQQRADLEKARIDLQKARIEATTRLTEAQTRAEQNRLLGQQGDKVLQLKRLELRRRAIEKWDGHTPLISNGGIPFVEGKL